MRTLHTSHSITATLLRDERATAVEGTHSAYLHVFRAQEYHQVAEAFNRCDHGPVESHPDGAFATA